MMNVFKFTNQKLQYFFNNENNIFQYYGKTSSLTPPFFSPNEIVAIKFTCTQNITL